MKSKVKGKTTRVPNPFQSATTKTERSDVSVLTHWMRQIIENKKLELGLPYVDTSGGDRKQPDVIIYESPRSQNVLVVMEAKPPYYDVFDVKLKDEARTKANNRKAKYFVTTNFKTLVWWKTKESNDTTLPEEQQIVEKYNLSQIENLDDIEQIRYSEPIKRGLEDFLTKLYAVHTGKDVEPKLSIDDFLIFRIQEKINVLSNYYRKIISDECYEKPSFAKELREWFREQGWSFTGQPRDFDKVAKQTAYLLVNKILFYNVLQAKRPHELDPLEIPKGLTKGERLQKTLQGYFDDVLKIDYERIYTTDFIDILAFPNVKEVVEEIKELVHVLQRYDFSKLGYDVIGKIFERLIPPDERHNLGQYFTPPDVVDLILRFCLHHEDDKVLDPACGAGTFLVRAYWHKKIMNQRKPHEAILNTLWGVDIAKFPAHLAMINLALNGLEVDKNYPNIIQSDFFELRAGKEGHDPEAWRKVRIKTPGHKEREVTHPRWFDAIVGNPPYTRQEEINEISPEDSRYKKRIINKALFDGEKKIADIGKRASIHAYFFVRGTKFLKEGGYFGFVVSNSWLDVEYGKGLQEFFLKNYKIIAIIESKVERWFEEADINTCIVILQRCSDKSERDKHLVRFVYLKKPLREFIPPAQDMWDKEVERLNAIDKLKQTILAHTALYENEDMRIFPKSQKELWDEGFDEEEGKYAGTKWGKYLRAPKIFFKILEKGRGKLVPLKEVAQVRRGITTGANEFFYLTEDEIKRRKIEKEFWMHKDEKNGWTPNYVIRSPRECKSLVVKREDLNYRALMIHADKKDLKNKNVLRYIKEGERKNFDKRPTCASRGERWYELPEIKAPILSKRFVDISFGYFLNPHNFYVGDTFFVITPKKETDVFPIAAFLNSTLGSFFTEVYGRTVMGEGVLLIYGPEIMPMPVLKTNYLHKGKEAIIYDFFSGGLDSIFKELGTASPNEVSLDKVKPLRRELDKLIMGEILGLTDEEQLEVYRAVVDLVKSRIEKAKSLGKRKKTREGIDVDALVKTIVDKVGEENLGRLYKEKILTHKPLLTKQLPKASKEVEVRKDIFGWELYYSRKKFIKCPSEAVARYLKIFIELGLSEVKIPKDERLLNEVLPELEELKARNEQTLNSYLESILNNKIRERIKHQFWTELLK